jgi:hypothetical protein
MFNRLESDSYGLHCLGCYWSIWMSPVTWVK